MGPYCKALAFKFQQYPYAYDFSKSTKCFSATKPYYVRNTIACGRVWFLSPCVVLFMGFEDEGVLHMGAHFRH